MRTPLLTWLVRLCFGPCLLFCLIGCSSARDPEPGTDPEPTAVVQPTPSPTPTSVAVTSDGPDTAVPPEVLADDVLTLVFWSDPARAPVVTELGQAFAEAYGVEVVVVAKELSSILDEFRAALSQQQDMPDIFIGGHDWIPLLAANGIIMPMDLAAFTDSFAPSVLAAMAYEGLHYGVPVAADNLALLYNPALLAEPPATWQELQQLAREQVEAGTVDVGLAVNALSPFDFYPVLTGFAGDLFRFHPETGFDLTSVVIDSAESRQAVTWLQDTERQGVTDLGRSWHEMHQLFQAQRVPMMITGPWSLPLLDEGQATYEIAAFPEGGRSFVNVRGYMINTYSRDPFLAWLFLAHLVLTEDAMLRLYEAHPSSPPAFLPAVPRIDNRSHQAFAALASQGTAVPNIPEMNEIWRIWGQALYAIFAEGADPAAALGGTRVAMAAVLEARQGTPE